jgi:hypothetical protein
MCHRTLKAIAFLKTPDMMAEILPNVSLNHSPFIFLIGFARRLALGWPP